MMKGLTFLQVPNIELQRFDIFLHKSSTEIIRGPCLRNPTRILRVHSYSRLPCLPRNFLYFTHHSKLVAERRLRSAPVTGREVPPNLSFDPEMIFLHAAQAAPRAAIRRDACRPFPSNETLHAVFNLCSEQCDTGSS